MKILFLSEFFEPEPMMKGLQFARAFVSRGHEVEVLTGFPNYPGGRVYPGYRTKPYQSEMMDGIRVHRVPLFPSHDRSPSKRIATYMSFAVTASVIGPFKTFRPEVIYVYHSPATLAIPAAMFKLFKGARVISDILDLWPDTVLTSGMWSPWLLRAPLEWLSAAAYRTADAIVVPAPGLKRLLLERGFHPDRVSVIYNWAHHTGEPQPVDREAVRARLGWGKDFVVLFAGTMGVMQALDTLIDASALLKRSVPNARIALIGGGVEAPRLAARAQAEHLTNVSFYGRVPAEEINQYLEAADAMIVHLKRDPLFEVMIPAKTQGYMAAGRPLVMAVAGDAAEIVARANCGITAEPSNPSSVAAAIERLALTSVAELEQMGRNGQAFYRREMSMESGVPRFEALFRGVRATEYASVDP